MALTNLTKIGATLANIAKSAASLTNLAIISVRSFLLKQDGGYLLLQNGGKIILNGYRDITNLNKTDA